MHVTIIKIAEDQNGAVYSFEDSCHSVGVLYVTRDGKEISEIIRIGGDSFFAASYKLKVYFRSNSDFPDKLFFASG